MAYVDILPNGCWYWTGGRSRGEGNKKWYGSFRFRGVTIRAHRFACEQIKCLPPLPRGWHRDHSCCFSMCVNPDHLNPMPRADNQALKIARQEQLRPPPGWLGEFTTWLESVAS